MAAKLGAHVQHGHQAGTGACLAMARSRTCRTRGSTHNGSCSMITSSRSGARVFRGRQRAQNFVVIVAGANSGLSPADVRAARDSILAAGSLICQLEVPIETTLEALRIAKSGGVRTILNPAPATTVPDEMLRLSDIVVPNETETELLTGMPAASPEQAEAAAHRLLQRGAGSVILTLGERGALFVSKGAAESVPGVEVDAMNDPTGAGDAFVGSLANFLRRGPSDARCDPPSKWCRRAFRDTYRNTDFLSRSALKRTPFSRNVGASLRDWTACPGNRVGHGVLPVRPPDADRWTETPTLRNADQ